MILRSLLIVSTPYREIVRVRWAQKFQGNSAHVSRQFFLKSQRATQFAIENCIYREIAHVRRAQKF